MALFTFGVRLVLLMAGEVASIAVGGWALAFDGAALPVSLRPPMRWHAHELLAGFIVRR